MSEVGTIQFPLYFVLSVATGIQLVTDVIPTGILHPTIKPLDQLLDYPTVADHYSLKYLHFLFLLLLQCLELNPLALKQEDRPIRIKIVLLLNDLLALQVLRSRTIGILPSLRA